MKATKKVTFATTLPTTTPPGVQAPFGMHMIDGKSFDGNVGQIVLLNTVEEWKIENATVAPAPIDHPFHIHINPFQVVEVFDPYAKLVDDKGQPLKDKDGRPAVDRDGNPLNKYVLDEPAFADLQCQLKRDDPSTWRDCHNVERQDRIWWHVFPISSGRQEADVCDSRLL